MEDNSCDFLCAVLHIKVVLINEMCVFVVFFFIVFFFFFFEIQVTVICSRAILVTVRVICKTWIGTLAKNADPDKIQKRGINKFYIDI